jgi:hypothetical protein
MKRDTADGDAGLSDQALKARFSSKIFVEVKGVVVAGDLGVCLDYLSAYSEVLTRGLTSLE